MAHMDVSSRRRAARLVLGFALPAVVFIGVWLAPAAAAYGPGSTESHPSMQVTAADLLVVDEGAGAGERADNSGLAATGSAQNQLLILGAAMMLAGGIAAYAVSRRHRAGHH